MVPNASTQPKISILLVDDYHPNLLALEALLADLGQDLVKANSGTQALRCLLDQDFAVVLLDVRMEGMDGFETARLIRQRERSRHTPIIFLTASESPVFPSGKAYELGAVDFLVKPLVPEILRAKVAVFVDLFRTRQEILRLEERDYQRRLAEESLRQSEQRFRVMADSAPVLLWMSEPDGLCSFFNRPWLEFTGQTLEHELGNGWAEGVWREDLARCMEVYLTAVRERKPFSMQYRLRRQDGEYRWVLDTGVPRYHPDGAFAGFIGSAVDITDHRQLEEQLLQAQKMEAIGRLAGGIAHDFNNLMTVVLGYSELLLANPALDEAARSCIDAIRAAGDRATALTRQLLAFSRKQVLAPKVLDLNAIIAGMHPMLRRLIPENIELCCQLQPEVRCIQADRTQIEQVILNLALNARDAMPQGGRLQIETVLHEQRESASRELPPGRYVQVMVRDTGHGMDAQTRAHLFEPFYTTKGPGKGTGLGLATVYGIVKQSGGFIAVRSEPDRGTEICISLPCVEPSTAPPLPATLPSGELHGKETVLLVEDEDSIRDLARRILEQNGYTVLEAGDAEEAWKQSAVHPGVLDLLVTDVVMPGMGGHELADRLQQDRPELKVLFISGYNEEGLPEGANTDLLRKPFLPNDLLTKVRQLLDRHGPTSPVV